MGGMNPASMAVSNIQRLGLQTVNESSFPVPGALFVRGGSKGGSGGTALTDHGSKCSILLKATLPLGQLCFPSHGSFQSMPLLKEQSFGEQTQLAASAGFPDSEAKRRN